MIANLSPAEVTRYAPQIALSEWGREAQEKLKSSRVLIAGAGALGSAVALIYDIRAELKGMGGSSGWSEPHTMTIFQNQPPVANFTYTCDELTVTFDGSSSYDPDGTITMCGISVMVDTDQEKPLPMSIQHREPIL